MGVQRDSFRALSDPAGVSVIRTGTQEGDTPRSKESLGTRRTLFRRPGSTRIRPSPYTQERRLRGWDRRISRDLHTLERFRFFRSEPLLEVDNETSEFTSNTVFGAD